MKLGSSLSLEDKQKNLSFISLLFSLFLLKSKSSIELIQPLVNGFALDVI